MLYKCSQLPKIQSENVMSSAIERSTDGSPIGMISIWETADPIPEGWLECNGQTVDGGKYPEYVSKFGGLLPITVDSSFVVMEASPLGLVLLKITPYRLMDLI